MKLRDWLSSNEIDGGSFARTIGVTRAAVNYYVHGQRYPRPDIMQRITAATDGQVRPEDFYQATQ